MTAHLLAYARIFPSGLLSWVGGDLTRTSWRQLGDDTRGPLGIPALKARWFFEQPHPKFGRMDPLCKIAVAASQMLARALPDDRDEVAQVGGTMLGCLEVDAQFEQTRLAGNPSPALFVYTLPSMFQGEVAILHKLRGRCTLLSAGPLSGLTALATAIRWIEKGRATHVLAIAADAAGAAAHALTPDNKPQSAAAAWLLSAQGEGPILSDAQFGVAADGARELKPGDLRYGLRGIDTLEALLLSGETGRVHAQGDGRNVSFVVG
ncbi:MAG: hypothetical protein IPK87_15970 [Planctomycetes bacterium]|nr:hypothetical protein [Planctomycetota bacterium]